MTICGQRWVNKRRVLKSTRRVKRLIRRTSPISPANQKLLQAMNLAEHIMRLIERT